jgi:hypothetical protein
MDGWMRGNIGRQQQVIDRTAVLVVYGSYIMRSAAGYYWAFLPSPFAIIRR